MSAPLNFSFWHLVYAAPAALATVIIAALLVYILVQARRPAGGIFFVLFLFATAVWSTCYALEPLLPTLAGKVFVGKVAYLGIATLPPLWLLFVLAYRGSSNQLSPLRVALLFAIPAATLVLVWTNDLHRLHWIHETLLTDAAPIPVFRADRGPWFYVNMLYAYVLLLSAAGFLVDLVRRSRPPYRTQPLTLLAASLVPWVFNLSTVLRISPLPNLDLTPLGFGVSGVLVVWAVFRLRLLDLVPAARGTVLDNISEAVFMFDDEDRLLDLNRAAETFLGRRAGEVAGQPVEAVCQHPALMACFRTAGLVQEEVSIEQGGETRWLEVRFSRWQEPGHSRRGRIALLHDITARKQAETDLRESETRYRTLLDATFEGIVLTEGGVMVDMNEAFAAMMGTRREQLIGRPALEITVEGSRGEVTRHMAEALTDPYEIELIHADGHHFPVEVCGKTTEYEGRTVRVAALRDLTRWKAAQSAEQQQRELAEALRDVAAVLNSTLDTDTLLDRILENVYRVLPHRAGNVMLIEDGVAQIVRARGYDGWADAAELRALRLPVDRIPNLRTMAESRAPLVIPDVAQYVEWQHWQETRWLRSYAAVPLIVDGQVVGFLNLDSEQPGFFRPEDVRRLQAFADQAAIAIRNARLYSESQRRNRQLALLNEITHAGIAPLEMDGLLDRLAATGAQILDARHSALLLAHPHRPDALSVAASSGGAALTGDAARRLAHDAAAAGVPLPHADLPDGPPAALALPLHAGGQRLGVLLLGFDQPRTFPPAELAWAQQAAELMALGLSRGQTVAELHARNEELDAFNHTVAHDLKSPLHGMIASLELLERFDGEQLSADGVQTLALARQSARRLNKIIDGLLTLSRMGADDAPREIVDVEGVVLAALARMDMQIRERGVSVQVQPSLPPVLGQEMWLEEVFANLISNAVKYIGSDNPAPTIAIFAEVEGGRVRYAVRDNGLGIDANGQRRLFKMFARFHPGAAEGVGLGLSIVKRIVERLDGSIAVESEPGRGTTFFITLPAVLEPA